MGGKVVKALDQDLLQDGRVSDGKPRSGHVVEAVDSAIPFTSLHVKLSAADLREEGDLYILEGLVIFFFFLGRRGLVDMLTADLMQVPWSATKEKSGWDHSNSASLHLKWNLETLHWMDQQQVI